MERILVVDDEIHIVRLLHKYMASKGYEVHTATDGREAIQKVKKLKPHIVLLDIIMPGTDGIDILREIKKINSKIVVIMVTAVIDKELAKKAIRLGADDYLTKPLDFNDTETCLKEKMTRLLS